jgi:hypothetical protein
MGFNRDFIYAPRMVDVLLALLFSAAASGASPAVACLLRIAHSGGRSLPKHSAIAKVCAAAHSKIADGLTTSIQKPVED